MRLCLASRLIKGSRQVPDLQAKVLVTEEYLTKKRLMNDSGPNLSHQSIPPGGVVVRRMPDSGFPANLHCPEAAL